MISTRVTSFLQLCFLACWSTVLFGQTTTATITGMAKDASGAVMPSVSITVKNVDTGAVRTVSSNQRGQYVVPNLAPGNYEVEGSLPGFQTARRTGIALAV